MSLNYAVRQAVPQDGASITNLFHQNPDGGRLAIAAYYHQDPLYIATKLAPNTIAVVAQSPPAEQLLGVGMVRLEENYQVAGIPAPTAVLNSLIVHHTYRRQGIAQALAHWRIEAARAKLSGPLLVAGVQKGNKGSMAVVQRWAKAIIGPLRSCLVSTVSQQPEVNDHLLVRWAQVSDFEEIATRLNQFYQGYIFYRPQTAASLARWLACSPVDRVTRRYAVVTDRQGNLLGGLGVTAQHWFMQMRVTNMPLPLRLLNKIVGIVPADGYLRQSAITYFWFGDAQSEAARSLWQQVRWLVNDDSTHLTFFYDPRSPFPDIIRLPRWLPQGVSVLAVSRELPAADHLLHPP